MTSLVGSFQLLLAAVLWGSSYAVSKSAVLAVDAYHLTLLRYSCAVGVFLIVLLQLEGRDGLIRDSRNPRILMLGLLGVPGGVLLMFLGLARTRPEHAAVIVASQPMLSVLLAWLHVRRPIMLRTVASIVLALAGVILVVTGGDLGSLASSETLAGDLLVLSASLCWVLYTLGARAFPLWSALRYTALTSLHGVLGVLVITLVMIHQEALAVPKLAQLGTVGWEIAYITFAVALLATFCWHSGIRRAGPDGVLFINFVPVTAFIIGVTRGSHFYWAELLGAVLVVTGLLVNCLQGPRRELPN